VATPVVVAAVVMWGSGPCKTTTLSSRVTENSSDPSDIINGGRISKVGKVGPARVSKTFFMIILITEHIFGEGWLNKVTNHNLKA
jgi:hypothetical protein